MPEECVNCDIMVEAIVLVNANFDSSQNQVRENLHEINGVEKTYVTSYGVYDFVAEVQTKSMNELRNYVLERIRKIDSVDSATTLVVTQK